MLLGVDSSLQAFLRLHNMKASIVTPDATSPAPASTRPHLLVRKLFIDLYQSSSRHRRSGLAFGTPGTHSCPVLIRSATAASVYAGVAMPMAISRKPTVVM